MKKLSVLLVVVALWAMPALQPSSVVLGQSRAPVSRVQEPSGRFRRVEGAIPYRYIVIFRNDVARSGIPSLARELTRAHRGDLRHVYMNVVKGFAVELPEAAAWALSKHPLVEYVEEEGAMTPFGTQSTPQGPSTFFGLDRIDQRDLPLNNTYNFNRVGSGVHAYILDTGIWPTHQEFGTRADVVRDTFGGNGIDDSITSHGTYVSGVLGGRTFGVAKNVLLHGVKVCHDNPFNGQTECPNGNILAGLDWVRFNHIKPAVVNMSLGGPANTTIDNAVRNTIASGVTCVVAAGNSNTDASGTSPARVFEAITVAASINNDSRAFYSNYGWVVDLFAPGGQSPDQFIPVPRSGFHHGGANNVTDGFTGTSAASPHAAGVAALYLESFSLYTPNDSAASPASVSNALTSNATPDRVSNIPENCWMDPETGEIFCEPSTSNLLLYSGFVAPPASNPIDDQRFLVGGNDSPENGPFAPAFIPRRL